MESIDDRIRKKQKELAELRSEKIELKRKSLREKKLIADSLEELVCRLHEGSKFVEVYGRSLYGMPSGVDYAACASCIDSTPKAIKQPLDASEDGAGGKLKLPLGFSGSLAYLCKTDIFGVDAPKSEEGCGWVIGRPVGESYNSPRESWDALAGRAGYVYKCGVCGGYLGAEWTMVSLAP